MTGAVLPAKIRAMWPYFPDLLATPVPRYTSFPTAAEFSDAVGPMDAERALGRVSGDASLYVHIPYCETICWYCGCNTGAANRAGRLVTYLDALHEEIALVGARLGGCGGKRARIGRVAFGGGSPNAVAPVDFVRLVHALTLAMPLDAPVWSVELDPRGFSREWARVVEGIGITRASLGVQTFAPHLQAAIGRIQPEALIERATELLRAGGVTSLNFDLMYGLPGQTLADLEATLERAVALGADRIALFGYAHVPHLVARQRRIDASALPDQATRFAMAGFGHQLLIDAGYQAVGFDHFARGSDALAQAAHSGTLRRNFQGFTEDQADSVIGLGASAISSFPGLLVQNEKNPGRYRTLLSGGALPVTAGVKRPSDERRRGAVIEALLCRGEARLSPALARDSEGRLAPFITRKLARLDGGHLRILADGLPYARTIAALFDPHRQASRQRFSSAV